MESISFLPDTTRGDSFLEAHVDHFSQGSLGTKIDLNNSVHTERVRFGRPFKRELELVNATVRRLVFIVVPRRYSANVVSATASIGLGVSGGINLEEFSDLVYKVVVPARAAGTDPQLGEQCPYDTCTLPKEMGGEAKVILATVENGRANVWFERILPERTKLVVLPRMFDSDPIASTRLGHNADNVSAAVMGQLNPGGIDVNPEMKEVSFDEWGVVVLLLLYML